MFYSKIFLQCIKFSSENDIKVMFNQIHPIMKWCVLQVTQLVPHDRTVFAFKDILSPTSYQLHSKSPQRLYQQIQFSKASLLQHGQTKCRRGKPKTCWRTRSIFCSLHEYQQSSIRPIAIKEITCVNKTERKRKETAHVTLVRTRKKILQRGEWRCKKKVKPKWNKPTIKKEQITEREYTAWKRLRWKPKSSRHFPYNENLTRELNTTSLKYCFPSSDAIDRQEKIHVCE